MGLIRKLAVMLILVVVGILLGKSVFAQGQPFIQQGTADIGLELRFPPYSHVVQGSPFHLHTHVFNVTNDVLMDNTTTSCLIHLYNHSGNHILESPLDFDSNLVDFELLIGGGNFSTLGAHSYIMQCNTSNSGGFASGLFEVTESGEEEPILDSTGGFSITIFILALSLGLFVLPFVVKRFTKIEIVDVIIKRSCFILGIYILMMATTMIKTISDVNNIPLGDSFNLLIFLFGIAGWIFMGFTLFKTLLDILEMWKMKKHKERYGDDE